MAKKKAAIQVQAQLLSTTWSPPACYNGSPSSPELRADFDTGISSTDNITNLDNSPGKPLQFLIKSTSAGATVTLYADGVALGSAVASGYSTLLTTSGTQALSGGQHLFTVRQTVPGQAQRA